MGRANGCREQSCCSLGAKHRRLVARQKENFQKASTDLQEGHLRLVFLIQSSGTFKYGKSQRQQAVCTGFYFIPKERGKNKKELLEY